MTTSKLLVFTGSYSEKEDSGIHVYELDESTYELSLLSQEKGLKNPTFLHVDKEKNRLVSIGEMSAADGSKAGEVIAYTIKPESGELEFMNRAQSAYAPTCHVQKDPQGKYLVISSYHGGTVSLVSLKEDGSIGEMLDSKQHAGQGSHPERQDRPHVHSAFFSPDGQYIMVQDLGLDKIFVYQIDREKEELVLHREVNTHAAAGPRHLVFHPNGKYAYVINEVDSTVTSYAYDGQEGNLTEIQTLPTLPNDFTGENTCAEITISSDGRFVYGSNRGHDSIVVYAALDNGSLEYVQHISTEGAHPRHFALTPSGNLLLVANRDTNNITLFQVNKETGELTYTGKQMESPKPVCVWPVYM
ncbi:lactonase family protein [Paenibacillus sp. Marseille-Q4541]|uniref:lactonase family protein n=1 Tax=Paenibacillus sp. Marseille-Q4541 TaxID=2831522 RepID=UPI001BA64A3C|nr:lactonase family protein [Paenibacillus sp. Marseille-Q4541]